MRTRWRTQIAMVAALLSISLGMLSLPARALRIASAGTPSGMIVAPTATAPLPLPHTMPLEAFERLLYIFLEETRYDRVPGWVKDKRVRDTGSYIEGMSYGTHPAVRVFYSPEVVVWLEGGRQGPIPDGAMMVMEMYEPPAARYDGLSPEALRSKLSLWTVMIRDSQGSKDGWFWNFYSRGQAVDTHAYPFAYPNAGFGHYCVRCHASAANAFTFASLRNIEGQPGNPIVYRVDESWRQDATLKRIPKGHVDVAEGLDPTRLAKSKAARELNVEFVQRFTQMPPVARQDVVPFPPVTYDHIVAGRDGPEPFLTSDQCMPCHDGQDRPFGPNMYIPPEGNRDGVNLSPFGEWTWSLMGLSGRDPVFHAQVESELTLHPTRDADIWGLCSRCHSVMAQRQMEAERPGLIFRESIFYATHPNDSRTKYGALARDGISCTVCHQMVDDGRPLEETFSGRFALSKPGQFEPGVSYIYGPRADPVTHSMLTTLGMQPLQSDYITSSRACASCHVVILPVYDKDGKQLKEIYEQVTYLEWLNSAYQNELGSGGSQPRTCQSCHMQDFHDGKKLAFRIANIQDQTYPESNHLAPMADITVPLREGYRRHKLMGINLFTLEMFNQFDDILGVRKTNFMTGSANGLAFAIGEINQTAQRATAQVEIGNVNLTDQQVIATVRVTNRAGHRFPSGVGFRRAFLEFKIVDAHNTVVWASGRTDALGIIVDGQGQPLPTEFFQVDSRTGMAYQPHYQTITDQHQVQIYEEAVQDPAGAFTTSFLNRLQKIKDNRLLPLGWSPNGPAGFKHEWAEETMPVGIGDDAEFVDGTGADTVTYVVNLPRVMVEGGSVVATLYYQAIPPYYLQQRFATAQDRNGKRLYYLASHLNLKGTHIENWKLRVQSASAPVQTTVPSEQRKPL